MNIPERIATLEQQLAQQTERRAQATAVLQESQTAILQLQGALAVLRELLSSDGTAPGVKESANVAEQWTQAIRPGS